MKDICFFSYFYKKGNGIYLQKLPILNRKEDEERKFSLFLIEKKEGMDSEK